jgi:hypothetical protein
MVVARVLQELPGGQGRSKGMSQVQGDPPEARWWCALGCGAELTAGQIRDGRCARCHGMAVELGWRYRDSKGAVHYASTWKTVPPEVRRST